MARKIINKLFKNQENPPLKENNAAMYVSINDWKSLVSRLDRTQAQVESCNEKIDFVYSKVMKWLNQIRKKLSAISHTQKELDIQTKQTLKKWEEKILSWVQPEQRKEDQKRVMDLMHRNTQFIQSYDKQLDSIKKVLSKNEYQLYQMLEQMRTIRVEMDLINRHQQMNQNPPSSARPQETSHSTNF